MHPLDPSAALTLNRAGKVKLTAKITYTPTGGDPRTKSRKMTLRKR
jgi:hypothetical protein